MREYPGPPLFPIAPLWPSDGPLLSFGWLQPPFCRCASFNALEDGQRRATWAVRPMGHQKLAEAVPTRLLHRHPSSLSRFGESGASAGPGTYVATYSLWPARASPSYFAAHSLLAICSLASRVAADRRPAFLSARLNPPCSPRICPATAASRRPQLAVPTLPHHLTVAICAEASPRQVKLTEGVLVLGDRLHRAVGRWQVLFSKPGR